MYIRMKLIIAIVLCFCPFLQSSAQLRQKHLLDQEWEFRSDKDGNNLAWEKVTIPHTWNATDGLTPDYYRGVGEYRYHLNLLPEMLKRRAFLRFEAVSQVADVYVNGIPVGTHKGSFNAFCFEVTSLLKKGDNLIEVKVSNRLDNDIAPLVGDFTVFGGIYRPVSLLLLPKTCITPLDHASSGIYIHQDKINSDQAELSIITKVNSNRAEKDLAVRTSIFDAQGKLVSNHITRKSTGKEETVEFINKQSIEHPVLWDGRQSPHLYRVLVEVLKGNMVVDSLSQHTGLRYYTVDADKGFFLNGKPYKIKGVNRHQAQIKDGQSRIKSIMKTWN